MNKNNILHFFLLSAIVILLIFSNGCSDSVSDQISDFTDSEAYTTLDRTIVPASVPSSSPAIYPYEISKFEQYGYGAWQYGPGLGYEKRLDLMPDSYNPSSAVNTARLLRFFTMSDIHITDKETPVIPIVFGYMGGNSSAYSPVILLTTQVLDGAIRAVNAINKKKPFDFGMFLGDNTNTNQYNELRWFLDVVDGKNVNPDSGVKDDPVPGANNDYQDEFKAEGLNTSIPWYQVLGNHDHYYMGVCPPNDYLRQAYTGIDILNMGNLLADPLGLESRGYYMGVVDGRTPNGDIYGAGPVANFATPPKAPAADPLRRATSKEDWKNEFLGTSTTPAGHGLSLASSQFACYSFEPKANIPIKVIVLDDTQGDVDYKMLEQGYLNTERYNWLVSELDKGQSEGKLMIIAAHIPLTLIGYADYSPITASKIIAKLNTYPNLLMWISGHVHRNKVTVLKSPDSNHPELGFWQVETSSLRDFPQQFRSFDIVANSDQTISIFATNIDPVAKEGSLAAKSRSYAIAAHQIFKYPLSNPSYNAELLKQLSPEMQLKIKGLGTPLSKKF